VFSTYLPIPQKVDWRKMGDEKPGLKMLLKENQEEELDSSQASI